MVRGEMHGHSEESSPGNKGEEQAPSKGDFYSEVEMLARGRREEGLAQRSNGVILATKALDKQYWSGAVWKEKKRPLPSSKIRLEQNGGGEWAELLMKAWGSHQREFGM